jgi:sterol desaturase/sphingolipid hydroxylase (fatty acid hydroxylase superfamily)
MLTLHELYQGWFVFWFTYYFIGNLFFPYSKAVVRPMSKLTNKKSDTKLLMNLIFNTIITACTIPIIYYIPQLIDVSIVTPIDYIFRYGSLILISEAWFYYVHRLMHHKWFYYWHKDHHSFIHPHALAGLYCSPVEMILVNQLSISIPFQILGYTYYEVMIFSSLIALNALKGHSGLELYLTEDTVQNKILLFLFGNKMHDIHHEYLNYNYGIFYILDPLHGTNRLN